MRQSPYSRAQEKAEQLHAVVAFNRALECVESYRDDEEAQARIARATAESLIAWAAMAAAA